ncbi:hypothetical protein [Bacillus sp. Marseille-Q3570]|uniref:hypothetical protein n=1 Tax=Bacillus sp. Marseille-Q3570 TaxID=2963522 RepID=UPI0021B791A2|nr:hypothetical protein [Bacillus sp. Marseille-Q3570]
MGKIILSVPFFWFVLSNAVFAQTTVDQTEHTLVLYLIASIPILFFATLIYIFGDYREFFWRKRALFLVSRSSADKIISIKDCRKISNAKKHLSRGAGIF